MLAQVISEERRLHCDFGEEYVACRRRPADFGTFPRKDNKNVVEALF